MKLKQRSQRRLHRILIRTQEEREAREHKNLMKRMSNINIRTHTAAFHIGRNDPCYCGNTYAGVMIKDPNDFILALQEHRKCKEIEKPVKFKNCCIHKHVGLAEGEVTPEMEKSQMKQQAYFDKKRRLPR